MDSSASSVELGPLRDTDSVDRFNTKAADYLRYRWDYHPQAFAVFCQQAHLTAASVVADVGAGPGFISRHLAAWVGQVLVVEPNAAMRQAAEAALRRLPNCTIIDARAEATTLPDDCVDAIIVGRALHWFDPEPTRREFRRILRPGGWLAQIGEERDDDTELEQATRQLQAPELGWRRDLKERRPRKNLGYYLGHEEAITFRFPGLAEENFEAFLGRLTSRSSAPDPGHPLRPRFEAATREVFDRFSLDGRLVQPFNTILTMGQIA